MRTTQMHRSRRALASLAATAVLARCAKDFPKLTSLTVDEGFGGRTKAQKQHFDDSVPYAQFVAANAKK